MLSISAVVLANLCVSYIMTSQTEEVCVLYTLLPLYNLSVDQLTFPPSLSQAEQIMKKIEKEEVNKMHKTKSLLHCIVVLLFNGGRRTFLMIQTARCTISA